MKSSLRAFSIALAQIRRDSMLVVLLAAPFLAAAAFKFGVPALDALIARMWTKTPVLAPYYVLFDIMLAFLTPYLACTISSFIMLEERDDNLASYYSVTPVGSKGYLASRLLYPAAIAFALSLVLLALFHLTPLSGAMMVSLSLLSVCSSVAVSVIVVSAAGNKVEGLALIKLTGISLLGMFAPFFLKGGAQFLFAVFPSFFLAKAALAANFSSLLLHTLLGIACSLVWVMLFYRVFRRKMN